jgi:hypothetical protein
MTSIDNPIRFAEVKRAINKLKKGKAPGLNGIPPEALKAWTTSCDVLCIATSATSSKEESTTKDGIKANVFLCQSKAT